MQQFLFVDPSTTHKSVLYGPFCSLLGELFPRTEGFMVHSQYNLIGGAIDFAIMSFHIGQCDLPIFFMEIKKFSSLNLDSARGEADNQMHERFGKILETFGDHLCKLTSISAMGTRFAIYKCITQDGDIVITPAPVRYNPSICNNTVPWERWRYDVMQHDGEEKLKQLAREIKIMVLEIYDRR